MFSTKFYCKILHPLLLWKNKTTFFFWNPFTIFVFSSIFLSIKVSILSIFLGAKLSKELFGCQKNIYVFVEYLLNNNLFQKYRFCGQEVALLLHLQNRTVELNETIKKIKYKQYIHIIIKKIYIKHVIRS